ncbi:MAG: hypothetical protein K2N18_02585, partial [Clostridia bacterium]|nr:hypothetical protein [Clostridia bacterium]
HRFPLGFSGYAVVCWRSVKFQPYFTALASNEGYTWWSHDIGGHLFGRGNEELYLRWLQFGVFSPINRLHSNNKAWSKEPWLYPHVESIAEDYMRLRHRLLPYLYTANVLTAKEGIPLVAPMYYYNKDEANAYSKKYRNQYYFGGQLLVSPIVNASDKKIGFSMSKALLWLPEGEWYSFFSGLRHEGENESVMYCSLDRYPVFAKAGAIIPMLAERKGNSTDFDELEIRVFPGENEYTMYDEQGSITFNLEKTPEGYALHVAPSDDVITKKLKIVMMAHVQDEIKYTLSCDGAVSDTDNEITIDCKPATVLFKREKFDLYSEAYDALRDGRGDALSTDNT